MNDLINLSDEQLQALAVRSDVEAEELLVKRCSKLVELCARPYFLAGGDSEDLMQEGMMGLVSAIRDFDPRQGVSFKAYAGICVKRRLYTAIKSATRFKHTPLNDYVSFESSLFLENQTQAACLLRSLEEQVLANENADETYREFSDSLSGFEAEILELFLQGMSYREMALRAQRPQKSIDNAVQRIRKKLAQYLEQGEISEG